MGGLSHSNSYVDLQTKVSAGGMHGRGLTSLLGIAGEGSSTQNRRMTSTLGTDDGDNFSHYNPSNL
jgi:hypothetical protein